jgi:hypothetical protein
LQRQRDSYENSDFSRLHFVEGKDKYVGDFINLLADESPLWAHLPDVIRDGKIPEEIRSASRGDCRSFIQAMNNIGNSGEAEALANGVDLSECGEIVDLGGGSGVYSLALCRKYPGIHSTIIDKREVLQVTEEIIAQSEEKNRITLRPGDFTSDPLGEGIDAALLSDVLYGESMAGKVLQNVKKCLKKKGLVIIRGYYAGPPNGGSLFGALFAVKELLDDPDRKIMDLQALERRVIETGFEIVRMCALSRISTLLIARK